jgi:catechol-2,3-dioxygenase
MIRYKKLGYVALNVTDIGRSSKFYEQIVGLEQTETNDKQEDQPSFSIFARTSSNRALPIQRAGTQKGWF